MAVSGKLGAFLREAKVRYTTMKHAVVYTAQEIAAAQHVPGRQLAKCVLVKADRSPVLAVLPATHLIDLKRLKTLLGTTTLTIGKEADIKALFPDVEVGAMSPFGNLYGVPVVVDRVLGESAEIVCNAGSHTDTIKIRYQDFARLVKPKVGAFGKSISGKTPRARSARPAVRGARRGRAKRSSRPAGRGSSRRRR
jgi:Ala-tRNA(Pro) deacylase